MKILAIDPGTNHSGFVEYDTLHGRIRRSESKWENASLLDWLRQESCWRDCEQNVLVVEDIEGMGLAVGKSTFLTCRWSGRFQEAWEAQGGRVEWVGRGEEKITLCGRATYRDPRTGKMRGVKDPEIRRAIIERFPAVGGGKVPQVGTKKNPGPLYGVASHAWSALAVAVTWAIRQGQFNGGIHG